MRKVVFSLVSLLVFTTVLFSQSFLPVVNSFNFFGFGQAETIGNPDKERIFLPFKNPNDKRQKSDKFDSKLMMNTVEFSALNTNIDENGGNATITVNRSGDASIAFAVDYTTADSLATQPADYTLTQGTLIFAAGETSKTFDVPIINDTDVEIEESFLLYLSNPTNGISLGGQFFQSVTINSDEPAVYIGSGYTLDENGSYGIPVERRGNLSQTISVDFSFVDGTATNGTDYSGTNVTLTFAANETFKYVNIDVISDTIDEPNETFSINLSNPVNASIPIGYDVGQVTITDDDASSGANTIGYVDDNLVTKISVNGNDETSLSSNNDESSPEFNAATNKVVFTCETSDSTPNICAVNADGTNETTLYDGSMPLKYPTWSSDGTKIIVSTGSTSYGIYDVSTNSFASTSTNSLIPQNPRFSPDGTKVVFSDASSQDIVVTNTGSSTFNYVANGYKPKWSPDGIKILFDDANDIYTINADGTNLVNLTNTSGEADRNPQWSNDGAFITYESYDSNDELTNVFTMESDGDNKLNLADGRNPQFSTDGTKVAYLNDNCDLSVMDSDGNNQLVLDNTTSCNFTPIWFGGGTPTAPQVTFTQGITDISEATANGTATVERTGDTSVAFSVDYNFQDLTATNGTDFSGTNGTLNFAAGETSKTISYTITDDSVYESTESFRINLTNPTNDVTLGNNSNQLVQIFDNEAVINLTSVSPTTLTEGGTVTATLTRTVNTSITSTVLFNTSGNSDDYIDADQTVTFAPGETTKTVTVQTIDDNLGEQNEVFDISLEAIDTGIGNNNSQGITILDNEPRVGFNPSFYEYQENVGNANVTVVRSGDTSQESVITYQTFDANPNPPTRYVPVSNGTLTFAVGETTKTISIQINDDNDPNPNLTFRLRFLTASSNTSLFNNEARVDIFNNESSLFQVSEATRNFSLIESATAEIVITRSGEMNNSPSIEYTTQPISANPATVGEDFPVTTGVLNFAPNETSKTVSIPITNDTIAEYDERFQFYLRNPNNGGYILSTTNSSEIKILENDRVRIEAIGPGTVNEGVGTAAIQVTRTEDLSIPTTIGYETADITVLNGVVATPGSDYTAVSGTLNFAAGEVTKIVNVAILDDSLYEFNPYHNNRIEKFSFNLINPSTGTFVTGGTIVEILDNDVLYQMETHSKTISEFSDFATINVLRLSDLQTTSSVNYETYDSSAVSPFDYTATSGTLTFAPNETIKTITIPIIDDVASEIEELFGVSILRSQTAAFNYGSTTVRIIDNDPKIVLEQDAYSVSELDGSINVRVFKIGTVNATVNYATQNYNAVAGQDYTAVSGTLSFNADENEKTINIPILRDNLAEGEEGFAIILSNPNGAILQSPSSAVINIVDPANTVFYFAQTKQGCPIPNGVFAGGVVECSVINPSLNIPEERFRWEVLQITPTEGDPYYYFYRYLDYESVSIQKVTITRKGPQIDEAASVNYATADKPLNAGGNQRALAGSDYIATSGTLNFAPGEISKTFDVQILNDSISEGIEDFYVTLSSPTNNHLVSTTTFSMAILDSLITFNPLNENGYEVNTNYSAYENIILAGIPIYRYGDAANSVSVSYRTTGGTATDGVDYNSTEGTVTFDAGEKKNEFNILVFSDLLREQPENVGLQLSNVSGEGIITDSISELEIRDATTLIDIYTINFGEIARSKTIPESTSSVQVKVQARSIGTRSGPISVDYTTEDITATAGQDYEQTSGTLTFAENETEKTVTINILNDSILDTNEQFRVKLSNIQGEADFDEFSQIPITIQDACFSFLNEPVFLESNIEVNVSISRTCDTQTAITVNYSTSNGTATAGSDYTATSGTFTFAPNQVSKSFKVQILDDNILEQDEHINLVMDLGSQEASNPRVALDNRIVIRENYSVVNFQKRDDDVLEGANFYTATVVRASNVNHPFSVDYETINDTAIAGQDYVATSGTLNFAAGELIKTIQIPMLNDTTFEEDEVFKINLLNATGEGSISYSQNPTNIKIIDNDTIPKVKFLSDSFYTNEAAQFGQIGIIRTGDSSVAVSVNVATSNGTATAGSDYTATNETINFAVGETLKYVNIPLVNDGIAEGIEYFNVTLSSSTGAVITGVNPVRMHLTEIKPQIENPAWNLSVVASGGLLAGKHIAGIALNSVNKDLYVATDTGFLQNTEELYFDLFKIAPNGIQTLIGRYFIPHYDLVNLEFNSVDGQIYTVGTDKVVYKINPTNGLFSVFNSNIGLVFYRCGLEFNAAGQLIFMEDTNPNNFYRVNSGSGLTLLGSVTADNNSNYGTRFGIQPDGDYVIYPDGTAASNPRITEINKNTFAFNYLSPTNVRTLGSAFGHSIGAIDNFTGDVFSSGGNFGKGSSVILFTNGASSLANNRAMAGATVPFVTRIGNNTVDGQNNITAKGVTDMEFGPRRDNLNGKCLYFADDVDETIYQACQTFAPTAASATISGKITTAQGRPIRNVAVTLIDTQTGESRRILSGQFGIYRFADVEVGRNYVLSVSSKRFTFEPNSRLITPNEDLTNEDFVATQ
jgi:hypothetical protein